MKTSPLVIFNFNSRRSCPIQRWRKTLKLGSVRCLCNQIGSSSLRRRTRRNEERERETDRFSVQFSARLASTQRKRSCHAWRDYFHARRGLINVTSPDVDGSQSRNSRSLTPPPPLRLSLFAVRTTIEIVIHACSPRFLLFTNHSDVAPPSCSFVFQFVGRTCRRNSFLLVFLLFLASSVFFYFFIYFLLLSGKQHSRVSAKELSRRCTKFSSVAVVSLGFLFRGGCRKFGVGFETIINASNGTCLLM